MISIKYGSSRGRHHSGSGMRRGKRGKGNECSQGNRDADFGGAYQLLAYHGSKVSGVTANIQVV